jgi:hypothetical protein
MLVVDAALDDRRDDRSTVDPPDATWPLEQARGLGFDAPATAV